MSGLPSLDAAARVLKGKVVKGHIVCPGPDHSDKDRSLAVWYDPAAPDGFSVHPLSPRDDWASCKDYVRQKLGAPEFKPSLKREEKPRGKAPAVAEYVYKLADGTPYLKVERTESKAFLQSRWTGAGWSYGAPKGAKVPYRLPELLEAIGNEVFVVEGEKDADALAALGFVATTNPGGAEKWTEDLNGWFKGRIVHVLGYNDEAGRKHVRQVASHLHGVAAEVRIVPLPDLPPKGDVSDWLASGGDPAELPDLCRRAPAYQPGGAEALATGPFRLTLFKDIDPAPRKTWLVGDMLGEGELSVLYGVPGSGKSALVGDAACHVAAGREWLGKTVKGGAVLYVAAERSALVKRRMAAWRLRHGIRDLPLAVLDGTFNLSNSPEHAERLVEVIAAMAEQIGQPVAWIIIDTKAQVMGGGDENAARDMMGFVANLARLQAGAERAQGVRPHVTVVDHVPHADPHRIRGHGALLGAANSTFRVSKEGALRFVEADKANDAPDDVRLAFALESVTLSVDEGTGEETTAPVVVAADPAVTAVAERHHGRSGNGRERGPRLSPQMRKAAEVITAAIVEAGTAAPPHVEGRAPLGALVVSKGLLDRYFATAGLVEPDNKAAFRSLWWRVRSQLVGSVVDSWADHFWLKTKPSPVTVGDGGNAPSEQLSEPSPASPVTSLVTFGDGFDGRAAPSPPSPPHPL